MEESSSPWAPQTHAVVQLLANLTASPSHQQTQKAQARASGSAGQSQMQIALQSHQSLELPSLEENTSGGPDLLPQQSKNSESKQTGS